MMNRLTSLALVLVFASPTVWAHDKEKHGAAQMEAGRDTSGATLSIESEAHGAVAALERFSAALSAGDLDGVAAELDPGVLILESGGAEPSRDEYLGGHAKHDTEFLKAGHITLKRLTAQASGGLVWVGSESEIHVRG